jgi:hypothetical protein
VLVANCSAMLQGFLIWQVTDNPELGLFRVKLTRNALLVLLKNCTRSRPQGRNADYTTEWIPGPLGASCS